MANLLKMKVADLRKLAEEKEIVGWQDMKKAELVEALSEPEAPKASDEEVPEVPAEEPPAQPKVVYDGKAAKMKLALEKQTKVRIKIPLESGELKGTTKSVTLNGYRLNIQKGVYVDVPEQVAEVLGESDEHLDIMESHPLKVDESNRELN